MILGNKHIVKTNRKEKFWYHNIRRANYFCYRYWWLVILGFLLYLFLWYWFCYSKPNFQCSNNYLLGKTADDIHKKLDSCCTCKQSYQSEIDRIRDSLGGKTGPITITLKWGSIDDLDLYLQEPSGNTIYYNKKNSSSGGHLDIDMNAGGKIEAFNPIENIYYEDNPPSGRYKVYVHYFRSRTAIQKMPYKVYVKYGSQVKMIDEITLSQGVKQKIFEFDY